MHNKQAKTKCSSNEAQTGCDWLWGMTHQLDMYNAYRGKGVDELNQEDDKSSKGCSIYHKHSNLCKIQISLKKSSTKVQWLMQHGHAKAYPGVMIVHEIEAQNYFRAGIYT